VPHGSVSGTLRVSGTAVEVSGWRGTVGHNWGRAGPALSATACWRAELVLHRGGVGRPLTAALGGAYEYGTAHAAPGTEPRTLPQE
jgi:hypothetical protein